MKNKIVIIFTILLLQCAIHAHAKLESGMEASIVLGQPDFNSRIAGATASHFETPAEVSSDGNKLLVAESNNHRVLIWNRVPIESFTPADVVVGQPNFTSNAGSTTAGTFQNPSSAKIAGGKLVVGDFSNFRVLVWNKVPTTNGVPADMVLGQIDFVTNNNALVTAANFNNVDAVWTDGKILIVCDRGNNRVLIYNSFPTVNAQPADVVLGQPNFATNTGNNGGLSARSLNVPSGAFYDGQRLFVGDFSNNRTLIWNKLPTANFTPADVVVGQPDFTTNSAGPTRNKALGSNDPFSDGHRLFIGEFFGNRVLVYNTIPTKNFAAADYVIGQRDFNSATAAAGKRGLTGVSSPLLIRNMLFVNDFTNNRVVAYDVGESLGDDLGPQFSQGKAVVGKVFFDWNGNGVQDGPPKSAADLSGDAGKDFDGNGVQS